MAATVRFLFFSRRLRIGMQIQVGFSFQGKKKPWGNEASRHSLAHLRKQNTVTGMKIESLPLPGLAI